MLGKNLKTSHSENCLHPMGVYPFSIPCWLGWLFLCLFNPPGSLLWGLKVLSLEHLSRYLSPLHSQKLKGLPCMSVLMWFIWLCLGWDIYKEPWASPGPGGTQDSERSLFCMSHLGYPTAWSPSYFLPHFLHVLSYKWRIRGSAIPASS
jgi:hypothetical protein